MIRITYQKNNGCIIQRTRNTILPYRIGETTSMGWKVLDIEYEYKNQYFPQYKYNILIQKDKQKLLKKKKTKEICIKEVRSILYYFIAAMLINFLKIFFGI